jgi:hypothetical protein
MRARRVCMRIHDSFASERQHAGAHLIRGAARALALVNDRSHSAGRASCAVRTVTEAHSRTHACVCSRGERGHVPASS